MKVHEGMTKIIAVINQKGGVGKTTTAVNLGAYLSKMGKKVLIVDIDPQGNATSGLGVDKNNPQYTIYDVLVNATSIDQAIMETASGLAIVPANASLAGAEVELVSALQRENKLKDALVNVAYDYVF